MRVLRSHEESCSTVLTGICIGVYYNGAMLNSTAACILGLLQLGPAPGPGRARDWQQDSGMSGWELHATAEVSVSTFWNLTRGQLYAELKRLAEAGLVEPADAPGPRGRQRYRITASGRAAFSEWLPIWVEREAGDELLRST